MRFDKLTTKFQQALQEAQSLAVGNDQQFIEPQHLLMALLSQEDGSTASLLQRAGVNGQALRAALAKALTRLPKVEGHGGEVSVGRDLHWHLWLGLQHRLRRKELHALRWRGLEHHLFVGHLHHHLRGDLQRRRHRWHLEPHLQRRHDQGRGRLSVGSRSDPARAAFVRARVFADQPRTSPCSC